MSKEKKMTLKEVKERIKGLKGDVRKQTVCALIGHSNIQTTCFGYYSCARCGDQVGDALASIYPNAVNVVIVGHNCKTCRKNYKALTWRDKFLAPSPFKKDRE